MYRAMTLKILAEKIDLDDAGSIGRIAERTEIRLERDGEEVRVFLDGRDVTSAIRSQAVTKSVSAVSMVESVREVMVREQRRMGRDGGIVLEGRDIGTVVFPDADLKVFMVADVERRAQRRQKELEEQGVRVPLEELTKEIMERDRKDSGRNISPLRCAEDAVIVDTSNMTIKEQVEFVVTRAKEILRNT
jgi:cytidylate kinase